MSRTKASVNASRKRHHTKVCCESACAAPAVDRDEVGRASGRARGQGPGLRSNGDGADILVDQQRAGAGRTVRPASLRFDSEGGCTWIGI